MAMEGALVVLALMVTIGSAYHQDDIRIGVLLGAKEGDAQELIVDRVLRQRASLQVVKERLDGDTDFHYHRAACRLRRAGCCSAVLSPSCLPLPGQVAVACPGAPSEAPEDPSIGGQQGTVGMRPDTTRATLDLLRDLGWQELIYLHDHPNGGEKLQVMFRVGYSALRLRVGGLLHVRSAREAAQLLIEEQEEPRRVLLDAASHVTEELLTRMTHAGRTHHSFLIMQPTLPEFWRSPELRALDVIGFSLPPPPSMDSFGPLTVEDMYFHDAALFLSSASAAAWRSPQTPHRPPDSSPLPPECEGGGSPQDHRIADILKKVSVWEGLTGSLQFSGSRTNVTLTVMRTSRHGPQTYGWWSNAGKVGGIRRNNQGVGGALPQIQEKRVLRITTRLSEPFLMRRSEGGNVTGEFEGFCADLANALCDALQPPLECHLYEAPDGRQGDYDPRRGTWDGMVGEIITGRADLAVGELSATAGRSRAVDFLEPFLSTSLSLLLSRPSVPPLLPSLSWGVWGAAAGAALLCGLLLHCLGRLSGAPDSIEASSAIWERRLTPLMSAWLTLGSALLQPTGVYPRSLSSRVLAGSWWAFTGFLGCMLIASMAAQLQLQSSDSPQLRALSLEAILAEALENGWPEIGVVSPSFTEDVIQETSVPLLVRLRERVRRVRSEEEGTALAQEGPGFALLTQSAWAERAAARRPCRLVAVHGSAQQGALAVALAPTLEPAIKEGVRAAFESLHASGYLGHLHRKWWIDNSQCKDEDAPVAPSGGVSSSSLLIFLGAALLLLLLSFGVQLSRRIRTKESRRQQLTFEDINFDQRLPTPPPEMLAPPPVLEVPQIEGGGRSEESFKDFFDRMRTPST